MPRYRSPGSRRVALAPCLSLALAACGDGPSFPGASAPGDARRGQQLLAQYQCGSCHAIPDVPAARGTVGPALDAYGQRSYIAGHLPNNPEMLARWIVNPQALVPGTPMPAMGVSLEDARDMAAYLGRLK